MSGKCREECRELMGRNGFQDMGLMLPEQMQAQSTYQPFEAEQRESERERGREEEDEDARAQEDEHGKGRREAFGFIWQWLYFMLLETGPGYFDSCTATEHASTKYYDC